MINTEISRATKQNLENIDTLLSAVFGNQVSQDEIPDSMRKAKVNNAAVSVFGGGKWLMNNPTEDLGAHWSEVGKLMVIRTQPQKLPYNYTHLLTPGIEARYRLATGQSLQVHMDSYPG